PRLGRGNRHLRQGRPKRAGRRRNAHSKARPHDGRGNGALMAVEREKIYECEVKRRRVKEGGGYEPFWKVKSVAVALADSDTEFRCKDCSGEVKLLARNGKSGTVPYVEHKCADDSEFCA